MKKILILFGLTVIVFLGLMLLTSHIETPFDGNNTYGFPLTFCKVFGGKRLYYPPNEFSILKFIFDILCAFLISFIGITIFKRLKPQSKES